MGPKISHMNIFAMSSIVHSACDDVVMIMRHIRNPSLTPAAKRYELMMARRTIIVHEAESAGLLEEVNEEEDDYLQMMIRLRNAPPPPQPQPDSLQEEEEEDQKEEQVAIIEEPIILQNPEMNFEAFQTVLELFEVHESDMDILYSLFRLTDKRGVKIADITDVLVAFCVVTSKNARECIMTALRIHNIAHAPAVPETINRIGLVHILMQLNSACFYFGDRVMDEKFVWDLSDSVISSGTTYTTCHDTRLVIIATCHHTRLVIIATCHHTPLAIIHL